MALLYTVHGHFSVEAAEPTEKYREAFAEDAGENEDVEEDEGGQHVEKTQN